MLEKRVYNGYGFFIKLGFLLGVFLYLFSVVLVIIYVIGYFNGLVDMGIFVGIGDNLERV